MQEDPEGPQMLISEELEAIKRRNDQRLQVGAAGSTDCKNLLAEVDRLREGLRLAKEWLKAADAAHWTKAAVTAKECQARESFRAWADKEARTKC